MSGKLTELAVPSSVSLNLEVSPLPATPMSEAMRLFGAGFACTLSDTVNPAPSNCCGGVHA